MDEKLVHHEYHDGESIPTEAPPEYESIFSIPDYNDVPPAAYTEPGFEKAPGSQPSGGIPALTFADFLPRCVQPGDALSPPKVEDLRSLMTSVNRWLQTSPQYQVIRCESIDRKMAEDWHIETDATVWHQGAFTRRNNFVQGVRLWVVPNYKNAPAQQLWYMNAVPKATPITMPMSFGMGMGMGIQTRTTTSSGSGDNERTVTTTTGMHFGSRLHWPAFESLDKLLDKLNARLLSNPLPGKVLTIETVEKKYSEAYDWGEFDPDCLIYWEGGHSYKLYINIIRIFFVQGEPDTPQQIGIDDHRPLATKASTYTLADPRFENYSQMLSRSSVNISRMQNVKITNMQTINVKMQRNCMNSTCELDSRQMEMFAGLTFDCSFVKVLRVCYLKGINVAPPTLSSRIFIPVRFNNGKAESMSQTLCRINSWLNCVGPRLVGVDTLQHEFTRMQMAPVNTERSQHNVIANVGHYWISGIRLYFDGPYQEPPPEVFPPIPHCISTANDESSCCTIL